MPILRLQTGSMLRFHRNVFRLGLQIRSPPSERSRSADTSDQRKNSKSFVLEVQLEAVLVYTTGLYLQDLSWLQIKPEPIWASTKENFAELPRKDDQKTKEISALVELPPLQQRLYPQTIVQLPTSSSSSVNDQHYVQNEEPNLGMVLTKQDTSLLQGLVVPEGVSPQDLIVLVELKCKDENVQMKKSDLPIQTIPSTNANAAAPLGLCEMAGFQTKIVDTTGNIRIVNLPDFDGKFTQSDKVLAFDNNVPLEKSVSSTVNSTASFLKAFEADVLNGVLKLESIGTENMLAMDKTTTMLGPAVEKPMETSFENTSLILPDTEVVSNTFK